MSKNVFSDNIFFNSIFSLGYADDIDLVSRNLPNLVEALQKLVTSAERVGLFLNEEKTKYMCASREELAHRSACQLWPFQFLKCERIRIFRYAS